MSLCNFERQYGQPPENCRPLKGWIWQLVQLAADIDNIRCNEDTDDPLTTDLEDLWGTCDVPPGGFVIWYNSTSGDTTYYVCPEGSAVGCSWTEFTF